MPWFWCLSCHRGITPGHKNYTYCVKAALEKRYGFGANCGTNTNYDPIPYPAQTSLGFGPTSLMNQRVPTKIYIPSPTIDLKIELRATLRNNSKNLFYH